MENDVSGFFLDRESNRLIPLEDRVFCPKCGNYARAVDWVERARGPVKRFQCTECDLIFTRGITWTP